MAVVDARHWLCHEFTMDLLNFLNSFFCHVVYLRVFYLLRSFADTVNFFFGALNSIVDVSDNCYKCG